MPSTREGFISSRLPQSTPQGVSFLYLFHRGPHCPTTAAKVLKICSRLHCAQCGAALLSRAALLLPAGRASASSSLPSETLKWRCGGSAAGAASKAKRMGRQPREQRWAAARCRGRTLRTTWLPRGAHRHAVGCQQHIGCRSHPRVSLEISRSAAERELPPPDFEQAGRRAGSARQRCTALA